MKDLIVFVMVMRERESGGGSFCKLESPAKYTHNFVGISILWIFCSHFYMLSSNNSNQTFSFLKDK